jgi:hypothetical protein
MSSRAGASHRADITVPCGSGRRMGHVKGCFKATVDNSVLLPSRAAFSFSQPASFLIAVAVCDSHTVRDAPQGSWA